MLGLVGQVSVAGGGEDGVMAEKLLDFDQIDTGLDQMGCIAVAQAVGCDLFFSPQDATTLCSVVCTPPRSIGVAARAAPVKPPWRLGNSSSGLWCVFQNRRKTLRVTSGNGTNRSRLPLESRICTR